MPRDPKAGVDGIRRSRHGLDAMKYTPGSKHWGQVHRDPIDSLGIVSQAQTRALEKAATAGATQKRKERTHKLGFANSNEMPVIQQPRILFDAFQDVTRTGPLPNQLREGAMPLYFSLNKKYLSSFEYQQSHGPDGLGKKPRDLGSKAGSMTQELAYKGLSPVPATTEEVIGAAEATMGCKLGGRPTTSLGLSKAPEQFGGGGGGGDSPQCRLPDKVIVDRHSSSLPVWQVIRSETKGFPYWYNRLTGESRWLPPDTLETMNSKKHLAMPEDRSWFNYQAGFYGRADANSTGISAAHMQDLRKKHEFVMEHRRGAKRMLQRKAALPDEAPSGIRMDFDVSQIPDKFGTMQNGASWEEKLLRLIVEKCEEHSGRAVSMREAFMKLDKDKVGYVSEANLQEILQNWTGMQLSKGDMQAVVSVFSGQDGKIRYLDVCRAMGGSGVHPLGGKFCVNIGSQESHSRGFEKVSIPNKSNTRLLVDLTAR